MDPILYAQISEVARDIRDKKISPCEVIEAHLHRIEAMQPKLNAFVHIDEEGARRVARAAEELAERFTGYDDQKHARGRRRRSVEREDLLQVNSDQALEMQERLWRLSWHR